MVKNIPAYSGWSVRVCAPIQSGPGAQIKKRSSQKDDLFFICSFETKKYLMPSTITCPNCHTQFEPDVMIRDEIQKEVNQKAEEWKKKKRERVRRKSQEKYQLRF